MRDGRAKRAAVQSYQTKLRAKLRELYGTGPPYSPGRVKRAAAESGVNLEHIAYAYAMYCSMDRFHEGLELSGVAASTHALSFGETRDQVVEMTGSSPQHWTIGDWAEADHGGACAADADGDDGGGADGGGGDAD